MTPVAAVAEFILPPELQASQPPEARGLARDQVRLMVGGAAGGGQAVHARFFELAQFLSERDLLVVNESATIPAKLPARTALGDGIALHLSTRLPAGLWIVEPRGTHGGAAERTLQLPGRGKATLLAPYPESNRLWIARLELPQPPLEYLARWGRPIAYPYVRGEWPLSMYQTVYAREPGSAEMPSAGRAFTLELLASLRSKGVTIAPLVLHAGVASPERDEPPSEEYFSVPPETAAAVNAAKREGRAVIAVGTTAVRALESAVDDRGRVVASRGWTDLIIASQRGLRAVDGLLTGFHEPRSTHLAMLEAIAGRDAVRRAYAAALDAKYLWHEFGDLHLLLPSEKRRRARSGPGWGRAATSWNRSGRVPGRGPAAR